MRAFRFQPQKFSPTFDKYNESRWDRWSLKQCELTFSMTFSVCCHLEILLPWQRDVTTSLSFLQVLFPVAFIVHSACYRPKLAYLWIWRQTALSSTEHNFYFPHSPSFSSRIKLFRSYSKFISPSPPHFYCFPSTTKTIESNKCKWRRRRENHRNVVVLKTGRTW